MAVESSGITVEDNVSYERWSWRVQRVARVVLTVILVAALMGTFGHGALSRRHIVSPSGGMVVEYERFLRDRSPGALTITARLLSEMVITLRVPDDFNLADVVPEPIQVASSDGRLQLHFATASRAQVPMTIRVNFETHGIGAVQWSLALQDDAELVVDQFIYP